MSTDPIRDEHESLQRAVLRARRAVAMGPETVFVAAMQGAMNEYLAMRAQGVSREDAVNGLETVMREVWPKRTTKFPPACATCEDTGWRIRTCWDSERCGRKLCVDRGPSWEHTHAQRCEACEYWAQKFGTPRTEEDRIAAAVKTRQPKPSGFTRLGR